MLVVNWRVRGIKFVFEQAQGTVPMLASWLKSMKIIFVGTCCPILSGYVMREYDGSRTVRELLEDATGQLAPEDVEKTEDHFHIIIYTFFAFLTTLN